MIVGSDSWETTGEILSLKRCGGKGLCHRRIENVPEFLAKWRPFICRFYLAVKPRKLKPSEIMIIVYALALFLVFRQL